MSKQLKKESISMNTELLHDLLKMTSMLVFSFLPIALIANYKLMIDTSGFMDPSSPGFDISIYMYFGASWLLAFLLCFVIIVIMFKVKERARKI